MKLKLETRRTGTRSRSCACPREWRAAGRGDWDGLDGLDGVSCSLRGAAETRKRRLRLEGEGKRTKALFGQSPHGSVVVYMYLLKEIGPVIVRPGCREVRPNCVGT